MSSPAFTLALQPICVRREQAAAVLGVSVDHFDEHVRPDLRVVRKGRVSLYLVEDLEKWARQNAAMTLGGGR
jgi:predicted nucleotidyltransferase